MDKEELDLAVEGSCREYFEYLLDSNEFKTVLNKIDSDQELKDEDWLYILERLKIVAYKSLSESEKNDSGDKLYSLICRIGMKIFKEDTSIYNECLKMYKYLDFIKKRREIDKDLLDGYDIVSDNRDENSLSILINQHREANIFRNSSSFYEKLFEESSAGVISSDERVYMNATTYSYEREKELVKKYKDVI